jgi:hypothetical protein
MKKSILSNYSRREALQTISTGFGYLAFSGLAAEQALAVSTTAPRGPHFPARAKRVIFACMRGGPSHVDTFDHKPNLLRDDGKTANGFGNRKLMGSPFEFKPRGKSGLPISELFPHLSKHADNLCLINGMHADAPVHPQCFVQLHTGSFQFVRPSVGAWVSYGLGTENENLPGFVSIKPPTRVGGAQNYGSAFMPAVHQGTAIGDLNQKIGDASIGNLSNKSLKPDLQRKQIDFIQSMNQKLLSRKGSDERIEGVIKSYELAYKMQSSVPELLDLSDEPKHVLDMYGVDNQATNDFGRQCLLARRMAEAGVRYIEITHANWDQHGALKSKLKTNCGATDRPLAALLTDLKQRGMLHDTLVIWGGEFGRTPHAKKADGRDHNSSGFSFWMAGGGVKGGMRYGATDEHGIAAVEDKMHFHDLHATILHLLGLDHERLTYNYAGRDFRLTDVFGDVAKKILA